LAQTIQVKRGLKVDLPVLLEAEFGFCTDTKEIFIGDGTSNAIVNGDSSYMHTQLSSQPTWVVTHNLNKRPSVTIVDSAGSLVAGDVEYVDDNVLKLIFTAGFSGYAYLN